MSNLCVYQVVIESSDEQGTYHKDYLGPATDDDAVRRAWTVFEKQADDRVVTVDQEVWDEDVAAMPPDGPEWLPS